MLDWEETGSKSCNGTLFNRSSSWFDEHPAEEEKLTEVELGCHEGSKRCKIKVSRVIAPFWRECGQARHWYQSTGLLASYGSLGGCS